jgi:hypothetical protein
MSVVVQKGIPLLLELKANFMIIDWTLLKGKASQD